MKTAIQYVSFIVIALLSPIAFIHAIDPLTIYTNNSITVTITPEYPEASKEVTITLASYSTDLARASFVWKVGNTTVLSGIGKKSYMLTAPKNGEEIVVSVTLTLVSGERIQKSIPIIPEDVDLLVESLDGYTPPFYRGRSLPVREGLVKVSAVPHIGGITDSKEAVYEWTQNTKPLPGFSGYGKRYLVYKNSFLDSFDSIGVTVSPRTGGRAAQKKETIGLYQPKVLLYQDHPSEGILFNKALLGQLTMNTDEKTFVASPYFSSTNPYGDSTSPALGMFWKINGTNTTPTEKNRITLRKPEGAEGQAHLTVETEHSLNTFQNKAETGVFINF